MIQDQRHLEEVLVGTLLASREYRDLIFNVTDAQHFPNLHPIYLEVCQQHAEGIALDEYTVSAKLDNYNASYLIELQMHQRTSEEDIRSIARVLKETADKRRIRNPSTTCLTSLISLKRQWTT